MWVDSILSRVCNSNVMCSIIHVHATICMLCFVCAICGVSKLLYVASVQEPELQAEAAGTLQYVVTKEVRTVH